MSEFFAMGGYAGYVWPSFALFIGVLAADYAHGALRRRRILRDIRARLARESRRT